MNVLYVSHRIPYPPNKGDKIRSFHQIQHLSREHTVHLACLVDEKEDLQHVKALEKYCASINVVYRSNTVAQFLAALVLFTRKPLSVAAFYSRKLEKGIHQRLGREKFDMIIVFSSAMAEYVKHISNIPKVIDFVDVDSEKWRLYAGYYRFPFSWIYRLEADRLARYEEQMARVFDQSILVSEKEAGLLRCRVTSRLISVIPNGVDLDYFNPNVYAPSYLNPPAIVFTGAMDYFPNVDAVNYFCKEIFPLIVEVLPEARFYIVGRNPTRQVRRLDSQRNVVVTGTVSDIRPYLAKAGVAVAPFRIARGIQNKILEAMAMGLPVVGTSVAFQGIQATATDGIWIADDPEGFAHDILALLQDSRLRHKYSLQARQYVEKYHRWQDHGSCLESLLKDVLTDTFTNGYKG